MPVVDLLREFERGDKAPPRGFELVTHQEEIARPAIAVPVPSRLTIPLPLPKGGMLRAALAVDSANPAAAARFRVGVSDHRIYEALDGIVVAADRRGWVELQTDLSAYAGFKWSLFYRPDRVIWRVVLATDAVGPAPARAFWGTPEVLAARSNVREYVVRRERLAK